MKSPQDNICVATVKWIVWHGVAKCLYLAKMSAVVDRGVELCAVTWQHYR